MIRNAIRPMIRPMTGISGAPLPIQLGAVAWYDFSDESKLIEGATANNAAGWIDSTGNSPNITQGTAANQPSTGTTTINGLNVLDWGAVINGKSLSFTTGANTDNWQDSFIVARWDGGSTFPDFNGLISSSIDDTSGQTADGIGLPGDSGTSNWFSTTTWWDEIRHNNTLLSSPFTALPDVQTATCINITANSAININGVAIGDERNKPVLNQGWRGVICEVVLFDRKLPTQERTALYNDLQAKWNL